MSAVARLLSPISRLRRTVRFRLWVWRTRLVLARQGCALEVEAPHGAGFDGPPAVRPTLQFGPSAGPGGGRLRIVLGQWVHLGRDLEIEVRVSDDSTLVLGDGVVCQAGVRVVLFGGEIRVGRWSHLRDGAMLKSCGRLLLDDHAIVARFSSLQADRLIQLDERVGLAERVTIVDSDHLADGSDQYFLDRPIEAEPVVIGRNTWVGANAVVMRGARIGRNALVGAGSVVRAGDYPEGWLVAGAPAKPVRSLQPDSAPLNDGR